MICDRLLDELMAVMDAAFDPHWREAWSRRQIADSLELPNTFAVLYDHRGDPLPVASHASGFILSRHVAGEEELLLIAVRPELRGRGIGRRMILHFATQAAARGTNRIFLEMRANNEAGSLYARCGFVPIGTRTDYYRTLSGESIDAITFVLNLDD